MGLAIGVAVLGLAFLIYKLLRPTPPQAAVAPDEIEKIGKIVAISPRSDAKLAFTGAKRFLLSAGEEAS